MLPDLFHALFYGIVIVTEYYVRNKGRVSNIRAGIICYDGQYNKYIEAVSINEKS